MRIVDIHPQPKKKKHVHKVSRMDTWEVTDKTVQYAYEGIHGLSDAANHRSCLKRPETSTQYKLRLIRIALGRKPLSENEFHLY